MNKNKSNMNMVLTPADVSTIEDYTVTNPTPNQIVNFTSAIVGGRATLVPKMVSEVVGDILTQAPDSFFAAGGVLYAILDGNICECSKTTFVQVVEKATRQSLWFKQGQGVSVKDIMDAMVSRVPQYDVVEQNDYPKTYWDDTTSLQVVEEPFSGTVTGKLDEFVDMLSYDRNDPAARIMVKAAIMAPAYHNAGFSPFWSVEGEGQGTGKTFFVQLVQLLHDGHTTQSVDTNAFRGKFESTDVSLMLGRLVSDGKLPQVSLIDDVNSLFRSETFRQMITSRTFRVRQMFQQPRNVVNHTVWYLTGNTAAFTTDELSRSLTVRLTKPKNYGNADALRQFVVTHRKEILGDIDILLHDTKNGVQPSLGRWADFANDVMRPLCATDEEAHAVERWIDGAKIAINDAEDDSEDMYSRLYDILLQAGYVAPTAGDIVFVPKAMIRSLDRALATAIKSYYKSANDIPWLIRSDKFMPAGSAYPHNARGRFQSLRGYFVRIGNPTAKDISDVQTFRMSENVSDRTLYGRWRVSERCTEYVRSLVEFLPDPPTTPTTPTPPKTPVKEEKKEVVAVAPVETVEPTENVEPVEQSSDLFREEYHPEHDTYLLTGTVDTVLGSAIMLASLNCKPKITLSPEFYGMFKEGQKVSMNVRKDIYGNRSLFSINSKPQFA